MIIYKGTHGVPLVWTLTQPDGKSHYDLTDKVVYFRMWPQSCPGKLLLDETCVITDTAMGKVEYEIKPGDFDCPGEYWAQFVVIEAGVDTVPFTTFLIQVRNVAVPAA